jgi:hypothetical protein
MRSVAIERIPAPDPETFRKELLPQEKPFIFVGVTKTWNTRDWSPEYLKNKIGAAQVSVARTVDVCGRPGDSRTTLRFAEALDRILAPASEGAPRYRLPQAPLVTKDFYPILHDLRLPPYVEVDKLGFASFWVSGRGDGYTQLHYDGFGCHNLNVQIKGKKSVWCFSPEDGEYLDPIPPDRWAFSENGAAHNGLCKADVRNLNPSRHPELERATRYEGTIEEGDAIYFPALWYHSFLHQGDFNVNVNWWWYQLSYVPSGSIRRWMLIESLTSFIRERRQHHKEPLLFRALSPEVLEFVNEFQDYLLHVRTPVVYAYPDRGPDAQWRALVSFKEACPESPYFEGPLPPRYPLGIGDGDERE